MKKKYILVLTLAISLVMAIPAFASAKAGNTATVLSTKKGTCAEFRLNNGLKISGKYDKKSGKTTPKAKDVYKYQVSSSLNSSGTESVKYTFYSSKDRKKYAEYTYSRYHAGKGSGTTVAKNARRGKPCTAKFVVKKPSGGTMVVKAKDTTPGVFLPKNGAKYKYSWSTKNVGNGAKKVTYKFTSCKKGNYEAKFIATYNVNYKDLK